MLNFIHIIYSCIFHQPNGNNFIYMTMDGGMTQMNEENGNLPHYPESYWLDSVELPAFAPLSEDLKVDVAIVGGGITGITTAYLLANDG